VVVSSQQRVPQRAGRGLNRVCFGQSTRNDACMSCERRHRDYSIAPAVEVSAQNLEMQIPIGLPILRQSHHLYFAALKCVRVRFVVEANDDAGFVREEFDYASDVPVAIVTGHSNHHEFADF
jgi:hypothetical protein